MDGDFPCSNCRKMCSVVSASWAWVAELSTAVSWLRGARTLETLIHVQASETADRDPGDGTHSQDDEPL
jgi:hypothetical protein